VLPLSDDNSDRQRWPIITAIFVVLNIAAWIYEVVLQNGPDGATKLATFITQYGVVPLEYKTRHDLDPTIHFPFFITLVTSMFLHGGWMHIIGNMLYLWIFGDNVEDRMGRIPFVIFYLVAGVAAAVAQIAGNPSSVVPTIGASGAISGVLGAYIVMFPKKRVRVIAFYSVLEVPAFVVLGFWIATQVFLQVSEKTGGGGVAYLAHIGGFAAGILGALIWKLMPSPQTTA
jgi:membrane associated rhomboid family serine protease